MKKLLISIGIILIMACVVVLFINANGSKKEARKARTEVKADSSATPCSPTCCKSTADKAAVSDPMSSCTGTCGLKTTKAK
jgi:uncharacterized alpha/beta hydrolase family protein